MRRDWDDRAQCNAFHYIASWQKQWSAQAFLSSGLDDYLNLVEPVLRRSGIPTTGDSMAELGCGAGRMTSQFALHYRRVIAVDLSEQMLVRARQLHNGRRNILWLRVAGDDLSCVRSDSLDFVFSYLVLQHLPAEALAFKYIREMLRIVRSGGAFLFQFNSSRAPTMNRRGRLAWRFVDALWTAGLPSASRRLASAMGLDPGVAGKSWRGAALDSAKVETAVRSAGGEIRELSGQNSPLTWCCGVKQTHGDS